MITNSCSTVRIQWDHMQHIIQSLVPNDHEMHLRPSLLAHSHPLQLRHRCHISIFMGGYASLPWLRRAGWQCCYDHVCMFCCLLEAQMWRQPHAFIIVRKVNLVLVVLRLLHFGPFTLECISYLLPQWSHTTNNPKTSEPHNNIHLFSSWAWAIPRIWVVPSHFWDLADFWLPRVASAGLAGPMRLWSMCLSFSLQQACTGVFSWQLQRYKSNQTESPKCPSSISSVPLAMTSHKAKLRNQGLANRLHFWMGEAAKSHGKECE